MANDPPMQTRGLKAVAHAELTVLDALLD